MTELSQERIESLFPESMKELWQAFKESGWSEFEYREAWETYGFPLTPDGEYTLGVYYYLEEGAVPEFDEEGIICEWYVHLGCSEHTLPAAPNLHHSALLREMARLVADQIVADGEGYDRIDIHPLIRERVEYLLTRVYTRGYWE